MSSDWRSVEITVTAIPRTRRTRKARLAVRDTVRASPSDAARRHFRNRPTRLHDFLFSGRQPSRSLLPLLLLAGTFALLFMADHSLFSGLLSSSLGEGVFKLVLNFLLITMVGGGVFAYFSARRDEQAKQDARIAALQALDNDLGGAYRAAKRIKRQMRARLSVDAIGGYRMEKAVFEDNMDALLTAQIAVEEVREHVAVRTEILADEVVARLTNALNYAARYLHDVYEDYEQRRVRVEGEICVIGEQAVTLRGFLSEEEVVTTIPSDLTVLRDDRKCLAHRFLAFENIEKARSVKKAWGKEATGGRRHRQIAMQCFRLCSAELRRAIGSSLLG